MNDLVQRAEEFARLVHRNQTYSTLPYTSHLRDVYSILKNQFGVNDEVILASAWLHDSIEETETTYETLKTQFGKEIADIVQVVTIPDKWGYRDKIIESLLSNKKAIIVKLVDRIVNTEWVIEYKEDNKGCNYKSYEESFLYFSEALRDKRETDFTILYIWEYLEALYNRDEEPTLKELQVRAKEKQKENKAKNPWVRLAGKYENDKQYEEVLKFITQDRKELDEREARYYDEEYQIVEERMYDQ